MKYVKTTARQRKDEAAKKVKYFWMSSAGTFNDGRNQRKRLKRAEYKQRMKSYQ